MYDIIVIGAGPSGISASIYAVRAGMKVLNLYYGESELEKAHRIDNYYGFVDGITGKELYQNGISQARNLGIDVLEQEVLNIEIKEDLSYNVVTVENTFNAKAVIIATGNKKVRPNIKGIEIYEGKGVSYCAICDGFFYRKKNVAIIGNGEFAIHEANDLENVVNSITIFTNGKEPVNVDKYKVDTRVIKQINGEQKVTSIELEDGQIVDIDGIFIAEGIAGGGSFAKKLGIILDGDNIKVDENMQTNIPGIFACGNLTGGLLQVNKATYEGAKAGLQAVKYIKNII